MCPCDVGRMGAPAWASASWSAEGRTKLCFCEFNWEGRGREAHSTNFWVVRRRAKHAPRPRDRYPPAVAPRAFCSPLATGRRRAGRRRSRRSPDFPVFGVTGPARNRAPTLDRIPTRQQNSGTGRPPCVGMRVYRTKNRRTSILQMRKARSAPPPARGRLGGGPVRPITNRRRARTADPLSISPFQGEKRHGATAGSH